MSWGPEELTLADSDLQHKKCNMETFLSWQQNSLLRGFQLSLCEKHSCKSRHRWKTLMSCAFSRKKQRQWWEMHSVVILLSVGCKCCTWGPHPWQGCRVAVWFSFIPWSIHRWLTLELRIWNQKASLKTTLNFTFSQLFVQSPNIPEENLGIFKKSWPPSANQHYCMYHYV